MAGEALPGIGFCAAHMGYTDMKLALYGRMKVDFPSGVATDGVTHGYGTTDTKVVPAR